MSNFTVEARKIDELILDSGADGPTEANLRLQALHVIALMGLAGAVARLGKGAENPGHIPLGIITTLTTSNRSRHKRQQDPRG